MHRLRDSASFGRTVRGGRRAGGPLLVLHLRTGSPASDGRDVSADPAQVGLVVSRAVGNAVHRNQVKRRLRHLLRARLAALPGGSVLVVRALPRAAEASWAELGRELDRGLSRLVQGS
ncbi:MAG: ribonuclease P protein component [Marmoricola sp.]